MGTLLEMNPSTFVLARRDVVSLRLRGRECRVSCLAGRLWVTASGCPQDSVLAPGEEATFTGRSRIVVEALRTATVRLEMCKAARAKARAPLPLSGQPLGLAQ